MTTPDTAPARPARSRAGRLSALAVSVLTLAWAAGAVDGRAGPIETVLAPSGSWTVETIHRAHGPDETPALIVGLHGYGIDQSQMGTLVNIRPATPHIYVAVRGRYRAPEGGFGWFAVGLNDGRIVFDEGELARVVNEIADLLPLLARDYGADPDRIHLVGYSQGGTLALHTALARPEAAASFTGFAGALLPLARDEPPTQSNPAPVLIGHGTRDPLISPTDIAATRVRLERLGRRVEVITHPVPHVVSRAGREAVERWLERLDQPSPSSGERP